MNKLSHNDFISRLIKIKPHLKVISEYIGYHNKLLVEDSNGVVYSSTPSNLLNLSGPAFRSAINKNEIVIRKFIKINGNKYDYSKVNYTRANDNITIICDIHGEFNQRCSHHLDGKGCPECGNTGGFSRFGWLKVAGNDSKLYIIKISGGEEIFYKFGITKNTINRRYSSSLYPYQILDKIYIAGPAELIYDTEKLIKNRLEDFKYIPKYKFPGWTECIDECGSKLVIGVFTDKERLFDLVS